MFDSPNGLIANHANLRGRWLPSLEDVAGSAWHGIDLLTRHSSDGLGGLVPDLPGSCSCSHAAEPHVAEQRPAVGGLRWPQDAQVLQGLGTNVRPTCVIVSLSLSRNVLSEWLAGLIPQSAGEDVSLT